MNKVERFVYDVVKKNPYIKDLVRNYYQLMLSIVPQKKLETSYKTLMKEKCFFGFHDKSPWSFDNSKLLVHKYKMKNREINKDDEVEIGYYFGTDYKNYKKLGTTLSWNWQQGAMLQWIGEKELIGFNFWDEGKNVFKITDLEGKDVKKLPMAIGAVSTNGKYALGYSFERLNNGMYGYGYLNENDETKDEKVPKDKGLSRVDIDTLEVKTLFSINDIAMIERSEDMEDAYHFFTHTLFSPNSEKFFFLHRWKKGNERLKSRIVCSNLDGTGIEMLPTDDFVSHLSWKGNEEIIAYSSSNEKGDCYHIFNIKNGKVKHIDKEIYSVDGHPQYLDSLDSMVTDTYPNRFRIQELSLFDFSKNKKSIIAKIYSPRNFKGVIRCDLHPRWDRRGERICVDTSHLGQRDMMIIEL